MCKETRNVTQGQERNVSEIDQGIDPVIKLSDKILKSLLLHIKGSMGKWKIYVNTWKISAERTIKKNQMTMLEMKTINKKDRVN